MEQQVEVAKPKATWGILEWLMLGTIVVMLAAFFFIPGTIPNRTPSDATIYEWRWVLDSIGRDSILSLLPMILFGAIPVVYALAFVGAYAQGSFNQKWFWQNTLILSVVAVVVLLATGTISADLRILTGTPEYVRVYRTLGQSMPFHWVGLFGILFASALSLVGFIKSRMS
jgi:hypothetical protein